MITHEHGPLTRNIALGVASSALVMSGCSAPPIESIVNPPRQIASHYIGELGNVAGACIGDGANVYETFPLPDKDGKPSNTVFGNILLTIDLDGDTKNGLQAKNANRDEITSDLGSVACFDIGDGVVTYTTTEVSAKSVKKGIPSPRFWFAMNVEDLKRNPKMSAIATELSVKKIANIVLTSDSTTVSGNVSANDGNVTNTFPKTK